MKAILFDWGGVCCAEAEPFASAALQRALKMTPDEITAEAQGIHGNYYLGNHTRDSFWKAVINHFSLEESAEINPVALSNAYLQSYQIYPDVLELISQLKRNYTTGLLSNLTPEMKNHIQLKHDLEKYFHVQVYSRDSDVASSNPDNKIFKALLDKIKLKPEDCLFIDNTAGNVAAAEALGMRTIFFKNRAQFFSDIKTRLHL